MPQVVPPPASSSSPPATATPVPTPTPPTHASAAAQPPRLLDAVRAQADVSTTMIYTHVLRLGGGAVRSPLDSLAPLRPTAAPSSAPSHAPPPRAREPVPCYASTAFPTTPSFTAAAISAS